MIYFDNGATSFPKAPGVSDAVKNCIETMAGNPNRASYMSSIRLSGLFFEVKEKLAELLHIPTPENIIFTSSATHALNLVLQGTIQKNDSICYSPLEHNAVMRPLRMLEKERTLSIKKMKSDEFGFIDPNKLKKYGEKNDFLIMNATSNVNGQKQNLDSIASIKKAKTILDLSQKIGYEPINIQKINPDFIAFPTHKGLLSLAGLGIAWAKDWSKTKPLILGGTGSKSESEFQPEFIPDKYESGTQNLVGIVALNKALDFFVETGFHKIREKKEQLSSYFRIKLLEIEEINVLDKSPSTSESGVLSIYPKKETIDELTMFLDRNEIATRMGLHCAPVAHKTLNTFEQGGTIRFSLGYFNTKEEIDIVVETVKKYFLHR